MNCDCHFNKNSEQKNKIKSPLSRRDMVMGLASGSLLLVSSCATNPETGRSQIAFVDDNQLAALSQNAWLEMKSKTKISTNTAAKARVERIGSRIAQTMNIQNAQWEYELFDDPQINAFVLPGGKVGVFQGLLNIIENDAQLACVLGHEGGHVTGRHASERMSRTILAQVGLEAAAQGASRTALSTGAQRDVMTALGLGVQYGVILPFSRSQELEADILGLRYMQNAGYDARESVKLWQKMAQAQQQRPPEFLSTHPNESTRIERLTEELRKMGYSI